MGFYQMLQLDVGPLKQRIAKAQTKKEKYTYLAALIVRDILLVLFAILFVASFEMLFGKVNTPMAIVIFCALLSIRFIDFGYNIYDSLISLGIVFGLLWFSPLVMQHISGIAGLILNFLSLLIILILTSDHPAMGNAGLYMFGYVFLTGSDLSKVQWIARGEMTFLGFVLCAIVLYRNHAHKHPEKSVFHLFSRFSLKNAKNRWQFQIALSLSILFLLGHYYDFNRFMWIGFACSSLICGYQMDLTERFKQRALGVILGSLLFMVIYHFTPHKFLFLFGPVAGLCLGLCSHYHYKTIFNCFGALLVATSIYGLTGAVELRIINNIFGLIFGYLFFAAFQFIAKAVKTSRN